MLDPRYGIPGIFYCNVAPEAVTNKMPKSFHSNVPGSWLEGLEERHQRSASIAFATHG